MHLDVDLCDLNQTVLTRLDRRKAGTYVELGVNAGRRALCPLSLDDDARALASAIATVLRITLKGPGEFSRPLFIGRVTIPDSDADARKFDLALNALDPFFHLERKLIRSVSGTTWNPMAFSAKDQLQILWSLISSVTGHGVVAGSLPASVNRDRTYAPGKEIGPALVEMTEVIGGPDFELEPVVATDGTLAKFSGFYPRQGEDKSEDVVFVFRSAPEDLIAFKYAPGGEEICNRFLAVGAPSDSGSEASPTAAHPAYLAEHAASITAYGAFERREQLDDVKESATLKAHAEGAVAASAFPTPYFSFTVAPERYEEETGEGVPPQFGVDYWLGDTIKVEAHLGDDDDPLVLIGRVIDVKLTERQSGQLEVELTCAPEVSATGITGSALTLKVPAGE